MREGHITGSERYRVRDMGYSPSILDDRSVITTHLSTRNTCLPLNGTTVLLKVSLRLTTTAILIS